MKRIRIIGRGIDRLGELARSAGLEVDEVNPEVIVCHGGDGTLLGAERDWPGTPKLALRLDDECRKCERHRNFNMLAELARGSLEETVLMKLAAESKGKRLLALNDAVIHNAKVVSAVRYQVFIGDELYSNEIVGDGLVATTPFGSSAYYRSITHSVIRVGIGVAFNNSTEPIDHIVLDEDETIRVVVTRGPAQLSADNGPTSVSLSEGDEILIRRDTQIARILSIDSLLCNSCARLDGRVWNRHAALMSL